MTGRRRPGRDRGSFTAELAAGLPALMVLLLVGLTAVAAGVAKVQCVDAARDGALAAARGEPAPPGGRPAGTGRRRDRDRGRRGGGHRPGSGPGAAARLPAVGAHGGGRGGGAARARHDGRRAMNRERDRGRGVDLRAGDRAGSGRGRACRRGGRRGPGGSAPGPGRGGSGRAGRGRAGDLRRAGGLRPCCPVRGGQRRAADVLHGVRPRDNRAGRTSCTDAWADQARDRAARAGPVYTPAGDSAATAGVSRAAVGPRGWRSARWRPQAVAGAAGGRTARISADAARAPRLAGQGGQHGVEHGDRAASCAAGCCRCRTSGTGRRTGSPSRSRRTRSPRGWRASHSAAVA